MKETAINLEGWQVRAVLDGRKTQHRVAVNPQPADGLKFAGVFCDFNGLVQATWATEDMSSLLESRLLVDSHSVTWPFGDVGDRLFVKNEGSIITMEITSRRVERLQNISDADALAEAAPCYVCAGAMNGRSEDDCHCFHKKATANDFQLAWESSHGTNSWDANPWVFVAEFKKLNPSLS